MYKVYLRKFIHTITALLFFFLAEYFSVKIVILVCGAYIILPILWHLLGFGKKHHVERPSLGEFYLPIGIGLTAWFFLPQNLPAFQFGVLVLGVCDMVAELIGRHIGRYHIKLVHKTVEGSIAFFISTLIIFVLMQKNSGHLVSAIGISLILTIIELMLSYGLDNLFLPLIGALLFKLSM